MKKLAKNRLDKPRTGRYFRGRKRIAGFSFWPEMYPIRKYRYLGSGEETSTWQKKQLTIYTTTYSVREINRCRLDVADEAVERSRYSGPAEGIASCDSCGHCFSMH